MKNAPTLDLPLAIRPTGARLPQWLYQQLRDAILSGRLRRGSRLPSTREFARQHQISRGTVITAFEQLTAEGYISSVVGSGTFVNVKTPEPQPQIQRRSKSRPSDDQPGPLRPFRFFEPGADQFPVDLWARIASRRLRRTSIDMLRFGDPNGYAPLREAVADYLARSRGVVCGPHQVAIVNGSNQSLDLIARLLFKPGDRVLIEDPGYMGAVTALSAAQVEVVPVAVDAQGLDPAGHKAKAAYVTPAHQFPLGITMPIARRLALLEWSKRQRAYVLEDDYDSEFRYGSRPIPALQGLHAGAPVIFMGSFNKVLFTSLRLAYVVLPDDLLDRWSALRFSIDRFSPTLSQAILCDFIAEGHFGRHLRRMRNLYAERLGVLRDAVKQHLAGAIDLSPIEAGLHVAAHLRIKTRATAIEKRAAAINVEALALDRFLLKRKDINALLLGFAAFEPSQLRTAIQQLATVIK